WKYLGISLTKSTVRPQKLEIRANIKTLSDVQKLVGDVQWIRTVCGITNADLQPLFEMLQKGSAPQES
ncbi:POK18 protein, partial [Nyctibius bracteatus]|nr:POK18 protein [Nyctibius bracteatus]